MRYHPSFSSVLFMLLLAMIARADGEGETLPAGCHLYADFESGEIPQGWINIDLDELEDEQSRPRDWYIRTGPIPQGGTPHICPELTSNIGVASSSWLLAPEGELEGEGEFVPMVDNWLITPEVELGPNDTLRWIAASREDEPFQDSYEVRISTDGSFWTDFLDVPPIFVANPENFVWTERTVDLAAAGYSDQSVYIAFRHYSAEDNQIFIDEIAIGQNCPVTVCGAEGEGISCPPGLVPNEAGTLCEFCPAGTFSDTGEECLDCPPGTISANEGSTGCISCGPGSAPNETRTLCENCPAGTFSDAGEDCANCPDGTISANAGSVACISCGPGTVPNPERTLCVTAEGEGELLSCPPGLEPNEAGTACDFCEAGTFSADGSACLDCPSGTVSTTTGATECTACVAGTAPDEAASECEVCEAGTFSADGDACLNCPTGTVSGNPGSVECVSCSAGSAPNPTSTACESCPAGTFSDTGSACLRCPPGSVSADVGATDCDTCPGGTVPNAEQTECIDGGEGEFEGEDEPLDDCASGNPPDPVRLARSAWFSDLDDEFIVLDHYVLVASSSTVTWWGIGVNQDDSSACDFSPATFEIRFFEDDDDSPGGLIRTETVVASGTPIGVNFTDFEIIRYVATLTQSAPQGRNWIGIAQTGDVDCTFAWYEGVGGGVSAQQFEEDVLLGPIEHVAFCLDMPTEGEGEGVADGEGEGAGEGGEEGAPEGESPTHTADQNGDNQIDLSELLRVIQFFNSGGYACAIPPTSTEDGYQPGSGDESCAPHASDYNPQDFEINLSELLRLIQFFNSDGYRYCPEESTEDGYCPVSIA